MLTRDQIADIRKAMTWGDQRAAKEAGGEDAEAVAVHAMYRAAKRLSLTNGSLDDFLDDVSIDDLSAVLSEDRDPTSRRTRTSRASADTGG